MSISLESLKNREPNHTQERQSPQPDQENQITLVTRKLIQLVKGDRGDLQENWPQLLTAAHFCKIDLEEKYSAGTISEEEIEKLAEAASELRSTFSSPEAQEVLNIIAINEKSAEILYVPRINKLHKSPEIADFHQYWQPSFLICKNDPQE